MRVLVANAGSSSLRLTLLAADDAVVADAHFDRWEDAGDEAVAAFVGALDDVDVVGHRVVHGGPTLVAPVVVDDDVERRVEELTPLAPLHQPRAVAGIRLLRRLLPHAPAVACFDTAFHTTMPQAARVYALPEAWRRTWPLDRVGFHGLAHAYASRRAREDLARRGRPADRIVVCHLGAGASVCAVRDGVSVDTTMGVTPLEGVVMATRSGSVDPGLLLGLLEGGGLDAAEVGRGLREEAGLLGLAGTPDMREVLSRRQAGDERAVLAFEVYAHRLAGAVASMAASASGLDGLVFSGGVGEHAVPVRAEVCRRLAFLGVAIDHDRNAAAAGDADLTADGAAVSTLVVTSREDLEIARSVRALLG